MNTIEGLRFPVPTAWQSNSRGSLGGVAIYGLLTLALVVFAVLAALHQMPLGVLSALLVASGFALETSSWSRSTRFRLWDSDLARVRILSGALEIARSRRVMRLDTASNALSGAGMLLFAVGIVTDSISLPLVGGLSGPIYAVIALVLGVMYCARAFSVAVRDKPLMRVTPDGVSLPHSLSHRRNYYKWQDVSRCVAVPMKGDRRGGAWLSVGSGFNGSHEFRVDESALGAHVTLLLIDFYRRNPKLRDELTDSRVLGRIEDGSLLK
ncbi:hypothetical protein [Gordonia metallireducens]|uniref:hypothetical protein n=1 Tax=Gordonia metallireducens TaxID=2897779 RepID=UPI001E51910C|nr:hypothetical protein [Gordonia metallireducens]